MRLRKFENCNFAETDGSADSFEPYEEDDNFDDEILYFLAALEDDGLGAALSSEGLGKVLCHADAAPTDLRGGAGGSHVTRKKRDISKLIADLEEWHDEADEDDMKRLLMKIC